MSVASIFNANPNLAQSLVAARGAKGPFASALASAGNALGVGNSSEANQFSAQQNYDQALSNLEDKLNQWFQAAGVDTSSDIQLILRADGTVGLNGDPEDSDKINEVLSNHPELGGMMQSVSDAYKQLNPTNSSSPDAQFMVTLSAGQATSSFEDD